MSVFYRCDVCDLESDRLVGWYIVDRRGDRPKLLICSAGCLARVAQKAEEQAQSEAESKPRSRWWKRS